MPIDSRVTAGAILGLLVGVTVGAFAADLRSGRPASLAPANCLEEMGLPGAKHDSARPVN